MPSSLFRDRNLALSSFFLMVVMGILMASSALLPPFLQRMMGHTAYSAGLITAPRGAGMAISMVIAGRLIRVLDGRVLIMVGLSLTMTSLRMMTGFTLDMGSGPVIVSGMVQGLGFGFIVLPLNILAFATLDPRRRTEAASMYNLSRNIGGSVMIAVATATVTRMQQISHSDLASHITAQSIPTILSPMLGQIGQFGGAAAQYVDLEVNRQASLIALIDGFYAMFWGLACALPFVLLMRPPKKGFDPGAAAVAE